MGSYTAASCGGVAIQWLPGLRQYFVFPTKHFTFPSLSEKRPPYLAPVPLHRNSHEARKLLPDCSEDIMLLGTDCRFDISGLR